MNKYYIIIILLFVLIILKIIIVIKINNNYKNNIIIDAKLSKLYSKSINKYLKFNTIYLNNKSWDRLYQHPPIYYNKIKDFGPLPDKTKISHNQVYKSLENNYNIIKDELYSYINKRKIDQIPSNSFLPERHIHDGKWKNIVLFHNDKWKKESDIFPKTKKILSNFMSDCYGLICFSLLPAGSTIYPHTGASNFRLRLHLGLTVPNNYKDCYIKIAEKKGYWKEGKVLVIDDSYIHSVKNNTDQDRIILIFDIWNPSINLIDKMLIKKYA
jgi:hypothetical protein